MSTGSNIPKQSGGQRVISAPSNDLKSIQRKLSKALRKYQEELWKNNSISPNIAHAFVKKKSFLTNAKIHVNKRYVLNIDLNNFFDQFHFGRVRGFFHKNKNFQLPLDVATVIAQLTCYNGSLPQGAPSSPIITNLICNILDMRILKLSKKYRLDYTRYADDMTFSTNDKKFLENYNLFYNELSKEINNARFSINENKTRLQLKDSRQEVTGIIVNKKINIDRRYYRYTKAMAHSLYTKQKIIIDNEVGTINQLEGRFSFIYQVDKYNHKLFGNKYNFYKLNGRGEEYRKFLFYKYFYNNNKPLIVTEGKTDVLYLKAALKKLYVNYPQLVRKTNKGEFVFEISFLNKSKKLEYLLGISSDGADSMKNIYNFFSEIKSQKNNLKDYYDYFRKMCGFVPKYPVILLFDNELESPKPLKVFTSYIKLQADQINDFKNNLRMKLIDNRNLYLITNPLVKEKKECEIEDLFDDSILNVEINGKTFLRKGDCDKKHFGKDTFSKYILRNYSDIDFSNFIPILNNISKICDLYYNDINSKSSKPEAVYQ